MLSEFLVNNPLKLNDDKAYLMVMTTSQKGSTMGNNDFVQITTPTEVIDQSETEKLLGAWIHQDMKWAEHILNNKDSLVRSLTNRVGALKTV